MKFISEITESKPDSQYIDDKAIAKRRERFFRRGMKKWDDDYAIGGHGYFRVLWLKNGKRECRSPRLYIRTHALKLLELMKSVHGQKNAIIFID